MSDIPCQHLRIEALRQQLALWEGAARLAAVAGGPRFLGAGARPVEWLPGTRSGIA